MRNVLLSVPAVINIWETTPSHIFPCIRFVYAAGASWFELFSFAIYLFAYRRPDLRRFSWYLLSN